MKPGTRLNAYEIVGFLGAGGMGEVYRATDTRLDRTVAIKILPDTGAGDPDRRMRFEREGRVVASLSHPHICALHDVGSAHLRGAPAPVDFLVMEYLEGETLAKRLARGALPLDEVVRFGREIASALEAAHRQRVVHRDLKPGNVMLTRSGVKLLDFGLAKTRLLESETALRSTATVNVSAAGMVLGTLPYMAPEQIEGRDADARSDIFAFGALLYEMATGRRAFPGESAAGIAAAILACDPPAAAMSPSLDRIIRGCLRRDPEDRWQSAQDVALQLRDVPERDRLMALPPASAPARLLPWIVAGVAGTLAVAAIAYAWYARGAAGPDAAGSSPPLRFIVPSPPDGYVATSVERTGFAISPDGTRIAMSSGIGDGPPSIRIRPLSSELVTVVPGTEGARSMFWSPDGRSLGFFADGKLKRVELAGGTPVTLCDAPQSIGLTGTWGDGQILFTSVQAERIMRVPADGGAPVEVLHADPAKGELRTPWPAFLPDGRRFLYLSSRAGDTGAVMLASLDGSSRELLAVRSNAQYVAPGFLIYGQEAVLVARRFDADTGRFTGEPVAIAESVNHNVATGLTHFTASQTGVVVYHSGPDLTRIVSFDRTGRELAQVSGAAPTRGLRLSPDGQALYVDRIDLKTSRVDLWKLDLDRGGDTRVTTEPAAAIDAVVAPDGALIFAATRSGPPRILRRTPSGAEEFLVPNVAGLQFAPDVSPDGRWVLYSQRTQRGNFDLIAISLPDRGTTAFRQSDADESSARFSPDGKFVAFTSDLGGRPDVYVAPFADSSAMRIVSTTACAQAHWNAAGTELFCVSPDGTVYAVPIDTAPPLRIGRPRALFSRGRRLRWVAYEVTPDGRFIALEPVSFAANQPLRVVVNWPALLFNASR
ncbi:MAG TPA: protein kinase [Vicinamibacterales bacterium]|nr:protein kinase [Vicinamibacterales bacterium]